MESNSQFVPAQVVNNGDYVSNVGDGYNNHNSAELEDNYSGVGEDSNNVVVSDADVISHSFDYGANAILINGIADILKIDMNCITLEEVEMYAFADLEVAYQFYSWYGRVSGFSVRKSHILKGCGGQIMQQSFVCSREGFRENRGLTPDKRKREPKNETRCGCEAKFRVHIDILTKRWYVTVFDFEHNHELLDGTLCSLLPGHRKLSHADIIEIENYRKVGIRPFQTYGVMANSSGGFHKVGFVKKEIYNQTGRQRKLMLSDSSNALKYLQNLSSKDPLMFVTHTVDKDKRLERIFWCDGESRANYEIFGDVVAFDATYRKNKYNCPVVIFSGVNHHNQTIVFATGIVTRETEETYVWLLEEFLKAMKGKAPISVITDGDLAMKNAIKKIFPEAHHRLCAWHLLRNASSNLSNAEIMPFIKRCMLADIEVKKFQQLWSEMVERFGLQNNNWINEMYEKKHMWATAYIRGQFFAGIRTTSRCEALHSHIGQFVHSRINLNDFVQQLHRCFTYFRFREIESDFSSNYGVPVLQTSLRSLERSGSKEYTREIFFMFRSVLKKSLLLRVIGSQEMSSGCIYQVKKYCGDGTIWFVTHIEQTVDFKCNCLRMESFGLPCDHILAVLVYLDFDEIPSNLIMCRWTKQARESIRGLYETGSLYWDSHVAARYASVVQMSKDVAEMVYEDADEYNHMVDYLNSELSRLKEKKQTEQSVPTMRGGDDFILNPTCVRTKGCDTQIGTNGSSKRTHTCSKCGGTGHNKRCCPNVGRNGEVGCSSNATDLNECHSLGNEE